ncbi:MAG: hypothetical protein M8866_06710 [marine benthic group bacterium]|nr:hypothetical protein [Candidatus Benthicola marisminoris]
MRFLKGILVAGVAWFAAGCMQFEYGITLEEDMSGTADVNVAIDLDRVAYISAFVQNAFAGEGGEPTEEQIQAAREEIRSEIDNDENFSEESLREEITPDLPDGVSLIHAKANRDDLLTSIDLRFGFDHVDQLREMRLDDDDEGEEGGAPVDSEPFEDLEIVEDGDFVIIRSEPINPAEEMEELEEMPWVSDEMVEKMLEGFAVTFSVTTPFRVEEHNATRKEGDKLVWEFNLETLKSGEATGIYAKLKR